MNDFLTNDNVGGEIEDLTEWGGHLSPFLPNTNIQYAWDSTSLSLLKTCPRLYEYIMIEGWTGKGDNVHLRFGIEYHSALQDYDLERATGISHDDAVHDVVRNLIQRIGDPDNPYPEPDPDAKPSIRVKTKKNLLRTVIWYLEHFKDDPASTVILPNGKPAVEVTFRFELDAGPTHDQPYLLCGHLDRVVEFGGERMVMDRKTTTTTPGDYFFDKFNPDNQMSLYTIAGQIVMSSPIRGVIIDAAQIAVDFSRFVRGTTYRTQDQQQEWLDGLTYWFALAESFANSGHWPMNDTSCDKYGGCAFRDICAKSPSVRENFLRSKFQRGERWNPLKPR